jgi:endonuclease-3
VKKESVVKEEGDTTVKAEEIVTEVGEVKAEDMDVKLGDIEDIGKLGSRRTPRKRL